MAEMFTENLGHILLNDTPSVFSTFSAPSIPAILSADKVQSFIHERHKTGKLIEFVLLLIISAVAITLISSLLKDIIFPPVNALLSKVDVPDWKIVLKPSTFPQNLQWLPLQPLKSLQQINFAESREISIKVGNFIETLIVSLIIGGLAIFGLKKYSTRKIV